MFTSVDPLWTASTGSSPTKLESSPAVVKGVVYIGANSKLWAFPASCGTGGATCSPLWTGAIDSGSRFSSPAVANGVVYIGSWAFPAGCGAPTCAPLWDGVMGDADLSSPAVANGVVYVGSTDDKLFAFPVKCGTGGALCGSLTGRMSQTDGPIESSPTVANGFVYVGSNDGKLYAYSAPVVAPGAVR